MTGHRSFGTLREGMSAGRRAANRNATGDMLRDMALAELRAARSMTQADLAKSLKVGQPAVAKLEGRADMYVSNLRRYVEALGGTLEITAKFPDASVAIRNFSELAALEPLPRLTVPQPTVPDGR